MTVDAAVARPSVVLTDTELAILADSAAITKGLGISPGDPYVAAAKESAVLKITAYLDSVGYVGTAPSPDYNVGDLLESMVNPQGA